MNNIRIKLLHVTTVPESLWAFFEGQIAYMRSRGVEVFALSSPGKLLEDFSKRENCKCYPLKIERQIAPLYDLLSFIKIIYQLLKIRPNIVHTHTPKASLLTLCAAYILGIKVRIYHVHGLPFESRKGKKKKFLIFFEKLSCFFATDVFCVSESLKKVLIKEKIVADKKLTVICSGSINGIDFRHRYNRKTYDIEAIKKVQESLQISQTNPLVVGFSGRIAKDKGISELLEIWKRLKNKYLNLQLLLVGAEDESDPVDEKVLQELKSEGRVIFSGRVDDVSIYYSLMNVLIFPTYREGLGLVVLEAAAMQVPAVASRVTGCVDAVIDNQTGYLVELNNIEQFVQKISEYLSDEGLRNKHGLAAREFVALKFDREKIWENLYHEYTKRMK